MLFLTSIAFAQSWTPIASGVEHAAWTASGPVVINALRIDLCQPGVRMRATTSAERGQRTSSWGSSVGVVAAVNGGFYSSGYAPDQGRAAGNGAEWSDSTDTIYRGSWVFGEHQMAHYGSGATNAFPSWGEEAVNGDATLVVDGVAVDCGGCGGGRAPRTAIGVSSDSTVLTLVAIDGRSGSSIGMTIDEEAELMASLGVWRAMNLDGGGSTTLWSTAGVHNSPSDGSERTVANHLGVFAPGTGLSHNCVWGWKADWGSLDFPGATGTTIQAPAGSLVRGSMSLYNSGTKTWDTTNTKLAPLPRDAASPYKGDDWISGGRITTPDSSVAPGQWGTFTFSLRMPATVGESARFEFTLLQELERWFGSSWGPVDGTFYLTLEATEQPQDTGDPDTDPDPDPHDSDTQPQDTQVEDTALLQPERPDGDSEEGGSEGCGCTQGSAAHLSGWLLLLGLLWTPFRRRGKARHS